MCQYCASKDRQEKAIQSELNDAYIMLTNRDKEIIRLTNLLEEKNSKK